MLSPPPPVSSARGTIGGSRRTVAVGSLIEATGTRILVGRPRRGRGRLRPRTTVIAGGVGDYPDPRPEQCDTQSLGGHRTRPRWECHHDSGSAYSFLNPGSSVWQGSTRFEVIADGNDEGRREIIDERRCSPGSVPHWVAAAVVVPLLAWPTVPAGAQDPRAPDAVGSNPDQAIVAGQSGLLDLTLYSSDADGDALAYAATVSSVAIATVSVSGSILTIEGVTLGTAVVTVLASDPGGLSVTQPTQVTVEAPHQAPEPVGTIPDQIFGPREWIAVSWPSYFHDPEGETLSFAATTSATAVAGVATSGDVVTITRSDTGTAIVNAVARDPAGLSVQQSITVTAGSGQVAPAADPPGPEPQEPVPSGRTPPDTPAGTARRPRRRGGGSHRCTERCRATATRSVPEAAPLCCSTVMRVAPEGHGRRPHCFRTRPAFPGAAPSDTPRSCLSPTA